MKSKEHFEKFCRIGRMADTCRYVLAGKDGMFCGKFTEFKEYLDRRVANKNIVARGDNCEGVDPSVKY